MGPPLRIYAVSRPSEVGAMFPGKPDVVGRVELSGLVIEHESGYRVFERPHPRPLGGIANHRRLALEALSGCERPPW